MQVNLQVAEQNKKVTSGGRVSVDPNPVRVREMLDAEGNVIDPRTKVILKKVNEV